jgi:hypothetical protein
MMNKVKTLLVGAMLAFGLVATPLALSSVSYAANTNEVQKGVNQIGGNEAGNTAGDFTELIKKIINILLFLVGAIAVIMIIIGGLRYVISGGDQGQITGAKNTILYAVIGLVVAVLAYAIVNWVLGAL